MYEWEIGVHPAGDPDDWSHYHPRAQSDHEAEREALSEARFDGIEDPQIYMVEGPFEPAEPATVETEEGQ